MKQEEKQLLLNEQHNIIHDREARLKASDYIAAKIAEGKATKTEYKDQIAERQQWRDDINAARTRIDEIEAIVPEPDEGFVDAHEPATYEPTPED